MLKLNKGLHFNILTIFAIVFVCVYLYYTISDLKKVAVEVKKHSQDITNIATSLATLNKHIEDLKKKGTGGGVASTSESCRVVPKVTVTAASVTGAGAAATTASDAEKIKVSKEVKQVVEEDDDDEVEEEDVDEEIDNDSVSTNDVKNLLSSIPDDDNDESNDNDDVDVVEEEEEEEDVLTAVENTITEPVVESVVSVPKSYKELSVDELKQQSYDDLKKYCKDNGLSTKGTKDVIIQRIKA